MIHSACFFPAIALRFAAFAILLAALLLAPGPVRAGADFIGGQANAEEDEDPEIVDGAFAERARAMQHWLQAREDERREMGVAHVYERPRAIVDHPDGPRRGHWTRTSLKSSAQGRRSSRSSAKAVGKSRSAREPIRSRGAGGKRSASAKPSGKAAAKPSAKSAARGTAKAPAKSAAKKRR